MIREYINNVNATQDSWFSSDPYYFVRIDSIDHGTNGIQKALISSFEPGDAIGVFGKDDSGFSWMGLSNKDASLEITFTKSFTLPSTGYYLIELFLWKKPTVSGNFNLEIEKDPVNDPGVYTSVYDGIEPERGYNKWSDYGTVVRVPIQKLDAGSHSFKLTVPKYAAAGWMKISHLNRYEGGKDLIDNSENRLDLIDAQFTQNGVNEVDTLDLTIAMKNDYWTDKRGNNPLAFDFGDHITFSLGQDAQETKPMFGGYIAGWSLSDDQSTLTLNCVDRLIDLKRTVIKKNFSIGYIPAADSAGTMPYTQFPNINEIARYLCTALYKIDFDGIVRDYKLYNNFSLATDVSSLSSSGFDLKWETTFGHPGTCMRLLPTRPGANSVTLWADDNETWNAADFNIFTFDYYASGAGVKYPVRFNIEIKMFRETELASDAHTYVIRFNGPAPTAGAKQLAQVTPKLNGEWQEFSIDLKKYFDKIAGSTEYWISEVKIVGYQDNNTVLNRRCSSMYIDHVMGFRNVTQAPRYASADSKNALEELQDLCEKTNQIAYNRPGMERRDDQLIMLPKRYYTIPITLNSDNVIKVEGMEYQPLDWGMTNFGSDTFNYNEKKTGTVKVYDAEGDKHYGIWQTHEFLADVKTSSSAQVLTKARVEAGKLHYVAFELTMHGSTLIEPGQYIGVTLPEWHINGAYEIQSITHTFDFLNEVFTSDIGFNKTTGIFKNMIKRLQNVQNELKQIRNTSIYASAGALAAGMETSLGAYSN
jgi:hypothetical protein